MVSDQGQVVILDYTKGPGFQGQPEILDDEAASSQSEII
jgi:hypothetical protein